MMVREQVDIEHYSQYVNTLLEAACMGSNTITERCKTVDFVLPQRPAPNASKKTPPVLLAELMMWIFACCLFQAAAFSQSEITAPNSNESIEPNSPAANPQQEIAALKKEELGIAEMLLKDFPDNVNAIIQMANLWERHGDADRAMEYFRKVLEKDPKRADVYKSMGWFYMNKQEYEQAIEHWQKALEIDPNIPDVHHSIALALMGQNKESQAIKELEKDVKISPRSSLSYFLLGQLHLQQQEYEKARDNYKKAIEIRPDYTNAYYGLFTLSARLKQQDKAKEYMAVFRKLKARDMEILKERNEAINDLLDMRKGAIGTYLLAGQMYQAEGNFQKAEEILKRATTLDPSNILCHERLASLYLKYNRLTDAIGSYKRICEINPKDPLGYLNIGILSERLKQTDNAEKAFRKVIEAAPGLSAGYCELAQLYLRTGRGFPEARQLAEKAVALEPSALNYFVLCWACDMNGDAENALKAIVRAIRLEPTNLKYRNVYERIKSRN
jgi:tetratricopeptide (TPR) repeat protein